MIQVERVYDHPAADGSKRFLVNRARPRGIKREALALDDWLRDLAPSDELRHWFGHDPAKWEEFQKRYFAELDKKPETWRPLQEAAQRGDVTLLYGARDEEHNNAVALARYLDRHTPGERSDG
jgi:uncharacterized protein YeaO (DUF488 family)